MALVGETDAALVWPARMTWPDPETITSLIEGHGADPGAILRPAYDAEPGWPVLVPIARLELLRGLGSERMPDQLIDDLAAAGVSVRLLDLGDPGAVLDSGTARADLPPYQGPSEPASGHVHEWGEAEAHDLEVPGLDAP